MKTRKHVWLYGIACVILVATILSVIVIATDNKLSSENEPKIDATEIKEDKKVTGDKIFRAADGSETVLYYKRNMDLIIHKDISVYTDSSGCEYLYDSSGEFIALRYNSYSPIKSNDEAVVPEEKALEIGRKFALKIFGEEFEKLTDNTIVQRASSSDTYDLRFDKAYGVDNFILGACCSMTLNLDGSVRMCSMSRGTVPDDFNEDLVKDLTREKVLAKVTADAEKVFGKVTEFNDEMITLEKIDGKYVIKINGWFVTPDKPSADAQEFCDANGLIFTSHEIDWEKRVTTAYSVEGSFYYALEP